MPEGAFVGSLSDFALSHPEIAARYYAQAPSPSRWQ
ncbi:hypothetical protein [Porphyromonas gingivalis]|nr:hypothetical protein [Porphyromonas gingivalis]